MNTDVYIFLLDATFDSFRHRLRSDIVRPDFSFFKHFLSNCHSDFQNGAKFLNKNLKLLEKNRGETLHKVGIGKDFWIGLW
jgi:hypothetical protein